MTAVLGKWSQRVIAMEVIKNKEDALGSSCKEIMTPMASAPTPGSLTPTVSANTQVTDGGRKSYMQQYEKQLDKGNQTLTPRLFMIYSISFRSAKVTGRK